MRRLCLLTLFILFAAGGIAAQQNLDYRILNISSQVKDGQVVVDFTIINNGTASSEQPVDLFDSDGKRLASASVQPLASGESVELELSTTASQFPSGRIQTFYVTVGLDQLPPPDQRGQVGSGSIGSIGVFIPPLSQPTSAAPNTAPAIIPSLDLSKPDNLALAIGIGAVVLILLWVISVIARLLFSRPPTFPTWQPPYVITPLIDPNSTNGRRQLWQQHAQSDTLPLPCSPGSYMVRKLLIGSSGVKLSGWHVTGLRISQYDRYGRVARSETIAGKGLIKSLDRAVRKSATLNAEHAQRAVRSVARSLTSALLKRTNKQNAILPVALDLRFTGMHGEVRILFELYGCGGNNWNEIDHWEPEMRVVNGSIHENFTYSLTGQRPEESRKQFGERLRTELTYLLAQMVQAPPPPPPPPPAEDTAETAAVSP